MKWLKLDERGAVSFLSVIIFMIIITVLILAYMQSAAAQQKNASNFDFSTRAYYAAESGIQDTIRAFKSDPGYQASGKTDCSPAAANPSGTIGDSADYGLSYTCQLINTSPEEITGDLTPNGGSAMIRLDTNGSPFAGPTAYGLLIRWSPATTGAADTLYARTDTDQHFKQVDKWHNDGKSDEPLHAMIRMSLIKVPKNTSLNINDIKQRVIFLNPTDPSVDPKFVNKTIFSDASLGDQQSELIYNSRCYNSNNILSASPPANSFACLASFALPNNSGQYNFDDNAVYLRLSTFYKSTRFSVSIARNDSPITTYPIGNVQAVMDVTGKAGTNMYRRVQQRISIGGGFVMDTEPDAALIGAEGICKRFSLGTTAATFNNNDKCNPLGD